MASRVLLAAVQENLDFFTAGHELDDMAIPSLRNPRLSPTAIRVIPFLIFVGLTACQGKFGEASRYWFYFVKTLAGAGMIWAIYPQVVEMRWRLSWDAVVVGVAVLVIWIGLDGLYPSVDTLFKSLLCPVGKHIGLERWCASPAQELTPWNPHSQFGPTLAWFLVLARLLGSTLVVPPLEEMFYRSFVYRYIARPDFEAMPLKCFQWKPFILTSLIFGFAHYEWLPGVLCGMLYQGLVIRHNRLGEAMTAHAITNGLLGLWIIWKGIWHFW